ncbi:MAG: DUF349 domain-containing protein [Flavobacteriales bacterium]
MSEDSLNEKIISSDNIIENEQINLHDNSYEQLISLTEELTENGKALTNSKQVENIKATFYTKIRNEKNNVLNDFLENGGKEEDFEFKNNFEDIFKKKYSAFKKLKNKERESLEKEKKSNHKVKLEIIKSIENLINTTETIKETFNQFNSLQEQWRSTGPAPININNELWQSYHHHVEKFYDYISINKDLRDLDFKKNLDKKKELCQKAENLLNEKSINKAHTELQSLHEKWKEVGPVEKNKRETIWNRFKDASHLLNKKRNEFFVNLKQKNLEKINLKNEICEKIKNLCNEEAKNHNQWKNLSEKVNELQIQWKKIGNLDRKDNQVAWKNFRSVINEFQKQKNHFYKSKKEEVKDAIAEKVSLCEQVEKLSKSKEWKTTTIKIIDLQKKWKETAFVPNKQSDQLWQRFRTACDTFFTAKKDFFNSLDQEKKENLTKKRDLLEKIKKFNSFENKENCLKQIDDWTISWNNIGSIDKKNEKIESQFEKTISGFYKKLKIEPSQIENIKFNKKLEILKTKKDENLVLKEKKVLLNKISELKKELNQYQTNISFFNNSEEAESFKKQVQSKIDTRLSQIKEFEKKLNLLNSI